MKNNHIFWTKVITSRATYYIMATEKGICWLGTHFEKGKAWVSSKIKSPDFIRNVNEPNLKQAENVLIHYIDGKHVENQLKFDLIGSSFQVAVWEEMLKVPYGGTESYLEVAKKINRPKAMRAVGAACGANPVMILVPCHRIVGSNGSLTGYAGGLPTKEWLLSLEKHS